MVTRMKTTVEIADALFAEARAEADRRGASMRSLIEEGLRRILDDGAPQQGWKLADKSVDGGGLRPEYLAGLPDSFYEAAYGPYAG